MNKRAVILINVGSPVKPSLGEVRKYLSEFLNDKRVIDLPWLLRKFLVNMIIIPFRAKKSTALYKQIWTPEGSPLILHMEKLVEKLNQHADAEEHYYSAMRYGKPSLSDVLEMLREEDTDEIVLFPLFPQYASSTSGTAAAKAMSVISKWDAIPAVKLVGQFYDDPAFIGAFAQKIRSMDPASYDHVLFSYHGLPDRHIRRIHPNQAVEGCHCKEQWPQDQPFCYKAACYETSRLLAGAAGIDKGNYSVAFQSRLSKNWLSPFTDDMIRAFPEREIKNILIVAPSFVSDCLETIHEIGHEYKDEFMALGGNKFTLVESLNDSEMWVKAIHEIVRK